MPRRVRQRILAVWWARTFRLCGSSATDGTSVATNTPESVGAPTSSECLVGCANEFWRFGGHGRSVCADHRRQTERPSPPIRQNPLAHPPRLNASSGAPTNFGGLVGTDVPSVRIIGGRRNVRRHQ